MKRIIALRVFSVIVVLLYCFFIFFSIFTNKQVHNVWFSMAIFFVGLILLLRYSFFGVDASLYVGLILLLCGISGVVKFQWHLSVPVIILLYISSFAFSSLTIFAVFRQKIHLKTFAFLFAAMILLVAFELKLIDIVALITCATVLVAFLLIYVIITIKRNMRKV